MEINCREINVGVMLVSFYKGVGDRYYEYFGAFLPIFLNGCSPRFSIWPARTL
jgi:hypothetical protein